MPRGRNVQQRVGQLLKPIETQWHSVHQRCLSKRYVRRLLHIRELDDCLLRDNHWSCHDLELDWNLKLDWNLELDCGHDFNRRDGHHDVERRRDDLERGSRWRKSGGGSIERRM